MSLSTQTQNEPSQRALDASQMRLVSQEVDNNSMLKRNQKRPKVEDESTFSCPQKVSRYGKPIHQSKAAKYSTKRKFTRLSLAESRHNSAESSSCRDGQHWQNVDTAYLSRPPGHTNVITFTRALGDGSIRPHLDCFTDSDSSKSANLRDPDTMSSTASNWSGFSPWYGARGLDDDDNAPPWIKAPSRASPVQDSFLDDLDHANQEPFNNNTDFLSHGSGMPIDYGLFHGSYAVVAPHSDHQGSGVYCSQYHDGCTHTETTSVYPPQYDENRTTTNEEFEFLINKFTEQHDVVPECTVVHPRAKADSDSEYAPTISSNSFPSDSSESWVEASPRPTPRGSNRGFQIFSHGITAHDQEVSPKNEDGTIWQADYTVAPGHFKKQLKTACPCTHEMDLFLVKSRRAGLSYKDIREKGAFTVAESTLRGRYRTLTKNKQHRVRRPKWTAKDVELLKRAVLYHKNVICCHGGRHRSGSSRQHSIPPSKIPWKKIADQIVREGGSYHFGNATCKKKWDDIVKAGGKVDAVVDVTTSISS